MSEEFKKGFRKGLIKSLEAVKNLKGISCLCGHFDTCQGYCKPDKDAYIEAIEKLIKNINNEN